MKERPILFSAPMVRAILDGRKTQTRRIAENRKHPDFGCDMTPAELLREDFLAGDRAHIVHRANPFGQPGDQLWVREAFRFLDAFDSDSPATVGERCLNAGYSKPWAPTHYEADGIRTNWMHVGTLLRDSKFPQAGKLRPSIHMPRWASRILLEITNIRVERLNDISEDDAIAEGCFALGDCECTAKRQYSELWESINGPGSRDANPWVWVIEFQVVQP